VQAYSIVPKKPKQSKDGGGKPGLLKVTGQGYSSTDTLLRLAMLTQHTNMPPPVVQETRLF